MRKLNTSGPNILDEHYTLPRLDLIEKGKALVHRKDYLVIFSPPQTGKTTYLNLLATELRSEGYKVAYTNFEKCNEISEEDFLVQFGIDLFKQWGLSFEISSIVGLFGQIEQINNGKMVLIVEGVEDINKKYLWTFLSSIRSVFHSREHHALKSVILTGVKNIIRVPPDNWIPFNIGDDFDLPYFSDKETYALLAQQEQETGQLFEEKVKAKILDITANHPSLVNGLAAKLMENFPDKPVLTYDDYLQVEDLYLKGGMGKNGSKIIDKAQKYRHFVERLIFTDEKARFMIFHERTKEIVECGLITHDKDYHIILKVPLFQKYLHAAFYPNIGSEIDYIQENIHAKVYLDETGCLNLDKVIEKYKTYVQQRGFLPFREQDKKGNDLSIPEAVMIYSFQTFIHALLGVVGGKSYLEANKALDKTYLIIHTRGHEQVVAAKIYQHYTQFGDSKIQLAHFAQRQGLKTGYFLVFVSSNVTLTAVIEADEIIEGIQIKTYLICYDSNKDFT